MKRIVSGVLATVALASAVVGGRYSSAQEKQDKYTLEIPGGLAFSEIRGYEQWQVVGPSLTEAANVIRVIVANPVMIKAYQEGVPGNGKPFPDGSKIVKLEWRPKKITDPPFSASTPDTVPGDLAEVHPEGQQEILRHARMGICDVRLRRHVRNVHPSHVGQQASGGARRQVRRRMPHASGVKGLHFHGIPQKVKPIRRSRSFDSSANGKLKTANLPITST